MLLILPVACGIQSEGVFKSMLVALVNSNSIARSSLNMVVAINTRSIHITYFKREVYLKRVETSRGSRRNPGNSLPSAWWRGRGHWDDREQRWPRDNLLPQLTTCIKIKSPQVIAPSTFPVSTNPRPGSINHHTNSQFIPNLFSQWQKIRNSRLST